MNKVTGTRIVSRLYFVAAIVLSFIHLVEAARKGGLTWESWTVPFMVDGIAIMGLTMRSADFAPRTRRIGFRVQIVAGVLSLAGNVYAAHNIGTAVFGVGVVTLFVFAEWLTDQIESAVDDEAAAAAAAAVAEAERIAAEAAAKRDAANRKRQATRRRNARKAQAQAEMIREMVNA